MEDRDFIDFKFGDHWASDFNLLAVSSGDRYSPPVYGSVNPNTATIAGKIGVYKWKTQVNEKVFNIKIAFDNINGQILNQIKEWLNPFKIDKLVFKEEPYKYYWVALNTEPKLDFLPFLEETKVVNGIAFKEGVYKGEFELQFVCFDNYGYSDWQSFDENYDYVVKEIEGEEFISFSDGSDNNLIITKIEGNSKQRTREEVPGTVISGSEMTINEEYISNKTQFVIDGQSEQKQYEGYNKLDTTKSTTQTINGVTITINENSSITFNGTMTGAIWLQLSNKNFNLPSGDYTWSLNPSYTLPSGDYTIGVRTSSNVVKMSCNFSLNVKQQTLSEDIENGFVAVYIGTITTFNNLTIYPMLVSGTYTSETIPSYEPYFGGQPSPNPEYPQDIEVIDGVNLLSDIGWERKIAQNETQITDSTTRIMSDYIKIEETEDYYISIQNSDYCFVNIILYDKNKNQFGSYYNIVSQTIYGAQNLKINFPNNTKYARFTIRNVDNTSEVTLEELPIIKPMLIKGTTPKPYLPHGHIGLLQKGKNLYENWESGGINSNTGDNENGPGIRTAEYIEINDNDNYSIYCNDYKNSNVRTRFYDSNKRYIGYQIKDGGFAYFNGSPFKAPVGSKYMRIATQDNYGSTYKNDIIITKSSVAIPKYEPYHKPKLYPINLNGNSIAKVGDAKDLLKIYRNGDVEIEKKINKVVLDGNENWNLINNNRFECALSKKAGDGYWTVIAKTNQFVGIAQKDIGSTTNVNVFAVSVNNINIKPSNDINTIDLFKSKLLQNPLTVYYQLAEPETIKLPSIEPIELWEGTNKFELITNLDTTMELTYNYLPAVPSIEEPSEIRNVGDNKIITLAIRDNGYLMNSTSFNNVQKIKLEKGQKYRIIGKGKTTGYGINAFCIYEDRTFTNSDELYNYCCKTLGITNTATNEINKQCRLKSFSTETSFDITYEVTENNLYLYQALSSNSAKIDIFLLGYEGEISNTELQEQTFTIPVQKPFRAVGNVRDRFIKKDGVWYEEHDIIRYIFDGTENWLFDKSRNRFGLYGITTNKEISSIGLCNYYGIYEIYAEKVNSFGIGLDNFRFYNDWRFETVDEFKSKLTELYDTGTPLHVDYVLATPELIPCTPEQSKILDEMENNLYSYEGTNHIFSTDEVSPLLSISYVPKQDIYIDYVVNQSNLLNDSAFYYENNIHKKSYFDAETGDATKSGISEDRPVYLYNAGTTTSNLNLTFDMIIPAEGSPLVINTESCKLTDNGIQVLKQISSISISDFSKYKPFLEIYDGTPSNWQIQIDSNLCEVYLKHKTDKTKIISLNKFNDNQSFLSLANCNFVDYSKPFPTLITAISGTALENTVFNKLSVGTSAQNYRLKNVNVEWKHTYL